MVAHSGSSSVFLTPLNRIEEKFEMAEAKVQIYARLCLMSFEDLLHEMRINKYRRRLEALENKSKAEVGDVARSKDEE